MSAEPKAALKFKSLSDTRPRRSRKVHFHCVPGRMCKFELRLLYNGRGKKNLQKDDFCLCQRWRISQSELNRNCLSRREHCVLKQRLIKKISHKWSLKINKLNQLSRKKIHWLGKTQTELSRYEGVMLRSANLLWNHRKSSANHLWM